MQKEIEAKILNVDVKAFEKKLKAAGAKQTMKPTVVSDVHYTKPGKKNFSLFRLRVEGERASLAVKIEHPAEGAKECDEYETCVCDAERAHAMVEALGFTAFRFREKVRTSYALGAARVEIDEYPGLAPYAEIEAESKKALETAVKALGYSMKDTVAKSATEVIADAGLNSDHLAFPCDCAEC